MQDDASLGNTGPKSSGEGAPVAAWHPIATAPYDVVVQTRIDDGSGIRNEQPLKRQGGLWWFADGSMYVYYTPTRWRPL